MLILMFTFLKVSIKYGSIGVLEYTAIPIDIIIFLIHAEKFMQHNCISEKRLFNIANLCE